MLKRGSNDLFMKKTTTKGQQAQLAWSFARWYLFDFEDSSTQQVGCPLETWHNLLYFVQIVFEFWLVFSFWAFFFLQPEREELIIWSYVDI